MKPGRAAVLISLFVAGFATAELIIRSGVPPSFVLTVTRRAGIEGSATSSGTTDLSGQHHSLQIPNLAAQISGQFEGCWKGTIDQIHSWRRLGGPGGAEWYAETVSLCFRRGQNDSLELVSSDDEETDRARDEQYGILGFHSNSAEIVSVPNDHAVRLRIVATCTDVVGGEHFDVEETYDINCTLSDTGQTLALQGELLCRCSDNASLGCTNNAPWQVGAFRTELSRVAR